RRSLADAGGRRARRGPGVCGDARPLECAGARRVRAAGLGMGRVPPPPDRRVHRRHRRRARRGDGSGRPHACREPRFPGARLMPSTWVYLARHGEVLHAAEGRFFGHTDVALSPVGVAQAAALGERLAAEPIEAVYASDLLRARKSATPLAVAPATDAGGLPPPPRLAAGRWEGLTFPEIHAREPELCARWLADPFAMPFPEGEGLADLRARVMPALRRVIERHAGQRIAIVAHGGTNRVILAEALGLPLANIFRLAQDYAAWSLIEYRGEGAVVHLVNRRPAGRPGVAPVESRLSRRDV